MHLRMKSGHTAHLRRGMNYGAAGYSSWWQYQEVMQQIYLELEHKTSFRPTSICDGILR